MMVNNGVVMMKHQVLKHAVGVQSGLIRIITYTRFRVSREESITKSIRKDGSRGDFTEPDVSLKLAS